MGVACSIGVTRKIFIKKVISDERTNRGERISQADNLKSITTAEGTVNVKMLGKKCLWSV